MHACDYQAQRGHNPRHCTRPLRRHWSRSEVRTVDHARQGPRWLACTTTAVIRLVGEVAVAYPQEFSPVTYIGEGNAFGRVYNHIANWIAPLLLSVPQLSLEIRIAEVARRNHATLYQHIEADLLRWFSKRQGALPWFNRQWEPSKEGHYEYAPDVDAELRKMIGIGPGTAYLWAIQPTHNNDQYEPYVKGNL